MTDGALANVRIIDLTTLIAAPFCTRLLADIGADVIKVEPPAGDPARRLGPFQDDDPQIEKSGLFFFLNTNKRSVTLDLETAGGRQCLRRLVASADMVVESFVPGRMEQLGLGYEELDAIRPGIVLVSITNFGQSGPYRYFKGSDLTLQAMGSEMYSVGLEDRPPLKQGGTSALFQAGATAAVGAVAGLFSARAHGVGQLVDVSIFEALLSQVDRRASSLIAYQFCGRVSPRKPQHGEGLGTGIYPCADGYVQITTPVTMWDRMVRLLGSPRELLETKWTRPAAQHDPQLLEEFNEIFYRWLFPRTRAEVWEEVIRARIICAPLNTTEDLFADPVLEQRGFWSDVDHPVMGKVRIPGRPALFSESPWSIRRPAPLLGEHTAEVLKEAGYSAADTGVLRQGGAI